MTDRIVSWDVSPAESNKPTLQDQYEGRVLATVIQDLATADPRAGEGVVMELVTRVWELAERHAATAGRTTWAHISWFVHQVVTTRTAQQMAGC
ncbi:hypothetical protein ACWC5I_40785 [Kitasatospora sp. NPDC001574]